MFHLKCSCTSICRWRQTHNVCVKGCIRTHFGRISDQLIQHQKNTWIWHQTVTMLTWGFTQTFAGISVAQLYHFLSHLFIHNSFNMNPHIPLHIYNLKHIALSSIMSYFCHFGRIQSLNSILKRLFICFVLISLKVTECTDFKNI